MDCYKKLFFLVVGVFLYVGQLFANPVITSISPNAGPTAGGTVVTISGSGFTGATAVNFGANAAAGFTVNTDANISATSPPSVIGPVHITVSVGVNTSPLTNADAFVYQGGWIAYAVTSASIFLEPIIVATNTLGPAISVADGTRNLAITPDGTTAYVLGNTVLTPVTLATGVSGATITFGTLSSFIAITPDGTTAYVCNSTGNTVTPITIATNTPGAPIPVGNNALGIAITPDGTTAYVCNGVDGTVTPITIATNTPGTPIPVGTLPFQIAITPDGKTAYVSNNTDGTVTPITIATNTAGTAIAGFGPNPSTIAITSDGQTAYVCSSTSLIPLTIATNTAGTPISLTGVAHGVTITPDGKTAYVSASAGTSRFVQPMNTATNTLGPKINLAQVPGLMAMSPDPAPLASFIVASLGSPGSPTAFDASASVSAVGTIASYAWDFGDGNTTTTVTPMTTHTYTSGGSFTARLTVTNSAGTSTSQVFTGQTVSKNGGSFATTTQTVTFPASIFPPSNVLGVQEKDRFLTQTDLINVITWSPPILGATPAFYKIYRDNLTDLIAVVPANAVSLSVQDHNRKKNQVYTYFLFSVDAQGVVSTSEAVTVEPN